MAKNFRGDRRGKKRRQAQNPNQNPNQNQNQNSGGGREESKASGRSTEQAGPSSGAGKRKQKRTIKNARSLSDVIGGASSRPTARSSGGSAGRPQRPVSSTRGSSEPVREASQPEKRSAAPEPEKVEKPKSAMSKMLKYIMSFTPPSTPTAPPADPPAVPRQPERQGKQEPKNAPQNESRRAGTKPAKTSEVRPGSRPQAAPQGQQRPPIRQNAPERNAEDFSWPKERSARASAVEAVPTSQEREERPGRRSARHAEEVVQGVVKRHPDGYGFLIVDDADHVDVYISRQSMMGVMTNDRVEVKVYKQKPSSRGDGKDDRLSGEITRVLTRANKNVVGRFLPVDQKYGVILDDGRGWGADLRIAAKDSMGAQEGQMVAAEVLQYPGPNNEFTGRVVGVIGDADDPVNDVIRVVHQSGIPSEFSALAVGEARKFGGEVTEQETKGREDLTGLPLITIDGATARDFDDAIWTEQTAAGFHLMVAIADVSHYVKPGTPLDQEAYERGTSTYFPNFVVPMLPEELSNELCSLKPAVKRLCFVCEMHMNFNGEVQDYRFFEGVMESKARVTYGQAQELLDWHNANPAEGARTGRSANLEKLKHVEDNILRSADLAKVLMAKRFREGSLDLEIPETQVVVDASGETVDVIKSERLFAHRLIEELMLVTNICTARFLEEREIPGIYRVHEEPDPDNLQALQRYLWNFGGSKSVVGANLQKKLSKALQSMEGKPEAGILNILTLRTMRQAHYSQDNVGHFGLGFSQYSHFTSPIRRYPDLIAHRLIKSQLYPKYRSMAMSEEDLASATTFLSACEQRSTKAERKVISIKKARFMKKFVGQEFDGVVSSVAKFGIFVLLRQFDVDGLVKVEKLGNDRFMFDDQNLRLIGTRTGRRYAIGDTLRVLVVNADVDAGKIDFELPADVVARNKAEELDSDEDDDSSNNGSNRTSFGARTGEPKRGAFKDGRSKKGRTSKDKQKAGSKKQNDVQERGKTKNNSRGVRKERVSKRRGKN